MGEIIDGDDKSIPWKKKAEAESVVDYVGEVELVFRDIVVGRQFFILQGDWLPMVVYDFGYAELYSNFNDH